MKFGVLAFISETSARPDAVARKCEDLGYESFWLPEHAIIPVTHKTPYPGGGDGKIPEPYSHIIDPFVGLGIASAVTSKIMLGTGICLVPERDPIVCAKEVATVDHFSGGRFLFGIGAGWLRDETEIMGVDFKKRWPMTRDYIRAMKELWTKPEPSYEANSSSSRRCEATRSPRRSHIRQSSSAREASAAATIARLPIPSRSPTDGLP